MKQVLCDICKTVIDQPWLHASIHVYTTYDWPENGGTYDFCCTECMATWITQQERRPSRTLGQSIQVVIDKLGWQNETSTIITG